MDLSQHLERSRVIWQSGIRLLCRELCLLEIALLGVEGDQREPGADRLRIHRHRLLEEHFDLARFAAERLHEIGVAQQRLFVLRLLLEDRLITLARDVGLLVESIELREVTDSGKIVGLYLQRVLKTLTRASDVALAQVDDALQVVDEWVVRLLFFQPAYGGCGFVELLLAQEIGD